LLSPKAGFAPEKKAHAPMMTLAEITKQLGFFTGEVPVVSCRFDY
jgi:hypothetical protein